MTTVGIHAPGAMGTALARCLLAGGHEVLTTASGRSPATARRLAGAGVPDAGSLDAVVAGAAVLVVVVPPGSAGEAAAEIAAACRRTGARPLVVEANAVAPATVTAIAADLPVDLVDAAISGPPPAPDAELPTRVLLAGERADEVAALPVPGVRWVPVEGGVGAASAAKMCTASVRKGLQALLAQALLTADHHGVVAPVLEDLAVDLPGDLGRSAATGAAKAWRFADEMDEIAATQAGAGLDPALFRSVAAVYRGLAGSEWGAQRPEDLPAHPAPAGLRPRRPGD